MARLVGQFRQAQARQPRRHICGLLREPPQAGADTKDQLDTGDSNLHPGAGQRAKPYPKPSPEATGRGFSQCSANQCSSVNLLLLVILTTILLTLLISL